LEFISPADTNGGNKYAQSRILGSVDNTITSTVAGRMYLQTRAGYDGSTFPWVNNLVLTSAGNVGIGTTNPATKLEVNGDIKVGSMYIGANEDGNPRMGTILNRSLAIDEWPVYLWSSNIATQGPGAMFCINAYNSAGTIYASAIVAIVPKHGVPGDEQIVQVAMSGTDMTIFPGNCDWSGAGSPSYVYGRKLILGLFGGALTLANHTTSALTVRVTRLQ
jgi:hypothetical protein